jgi:uncharacterized membrane protein
MNPPNDWEIKDCMRLSLAFLLANLVLIGLAALGFGIPVLRQIVGFIFLTFIPGILILRILRIHNISAIESLVYSVGLSLAFVMFTGLFANFTLPLIGIFNPISVFPLVATVAVFTLILGAVAYARDRSFSAGPRQFNIKEFLSLPYLLLFLLPLLAILGAHLVNLCQNNFLLLFFIIVVAGVVAAVAFDKLPQKAYPLAIVLIGLSLLLHISLISSQLYGCDIQVEYYFQNQVFQNGYWYFTVPHNYNTALSIVLLCPTYSLLLNMDTILVFKTIYPLIFCLVPLALFYIFRGHIGDKRAFFSAFFFMSVMTFFITMPTLARQQIAELFLTLLILLLIDRKLALNQKMTLAIISAMFLIVSHYALGYIFLAFLLGGWAIVALIRSRPGRRFWGWLTQKSGGLPESLSSQGGFPHKIMAVIVCVYLVVALAWYGGIAQGKALNTITRIGQSQYTLLSEELPELIQPGGPGKPGSKLLEPTQREALVRIGLGFDFASASPSGKGFRIFQYLTELFIVVGFLWIIFKPKSFKFKPEYIALSIVAALILLACIVIPRFSTYLNLSRFYHIGLFLLAPFCILGGEAIWRGTSSLAKSVSSQLKLGRRSALSSQPRGNNSAYLRVFALAILIPYFLFTSGFVSEVTGNELWLTEDTPHSPALSSYWLDMQVFNRKEAEAAIYLRQIMGDDTIVYVDRWGRLILYEQLLWQVAELPASGEVPEDAYIFLRSWNIDKREVLVAEFYGVQREYKHINLSEMPALLEGRELIYDNGGAQIWSPR